MREQKPPLKFCKPFELLAYFERGFTSFPTSNIDYVGQKYAKLHPPIFENDSNPGTLEPKLQVLAHILAEMAELAELFLRPPTFIEYL